jgi:RpiB/LacA/LacB family sugar-phosphate isomerase
MSNILIPIAGKAQRFIDRGYLLPKPLIVVDGKHMIEHAMDSIWWEPHRLIFVVRKDHVTNHAIDKILKKLYGQDVGIVVVDKVTQGTLCTCLLAEHLIDNDKPLVIYTPDVMFRPYWNPTDMKGDGIILTFKANNPAHSYVKLDHAEYVIQTAEKEVISSDAAVGVYGFRRGSDFVAAAKRMIEKQITTNGEYYVCPVYNEIGYGQVSIERVEKMHVLGTPEDVEFFNRVSKIFGKTKPVALCSDHSGFELKEIAKQILESRDIKYIDFGTYVDTDCDHYDFLFQAVRAIEDGSCDFGMSFCRTGQAFNIAANKVDKIRSALVIDQYMAEHAVRHNAANFFSVPTKYVQWDELNAIVAALMNNTFDGGRHANRIQKMERLYEK